MFRSVAFLSLVLSHVAPTFAPRTEAATVLSSLGKRYDVDPLLVIADVKHESQWKSWVVNQKSGAVGLMQIMPFTVSSAALLDWHTNLRVGFADFAAARRYCVKRGYGGLAVQWLWLPTGLDAVNHSSCGWKHGVRLRTPENIRWLMARRAELERVR
jgi:hypothetical protein